MHCVAKVQILYNFRAGHTHTHTQYVIILLASIVRACHFLGLRNLFVDDWYEFLIGQGKCFVVTYPRSQLIPSFHLYVGSN